MTRSDVIGIPMRANSCAATVAASCSLSTSTPLQSKMITETAPARPPHRPDQAVQRINAPALEIARKWQNSGVMPRRDSFAQIVCVGSEARRGLIELTLEVGDPFDDEIVGDLALDGMGQDSFGCGNGGLCGGRAHVG